MVATGAIKPLLADLSGTGLEEVIARLGAKPFRARQVFHWLHKQKVWDPAAMSNLPADLKQALAQEFDASPLKLAAEAQSADGTIKYCWTTRHNNPVEAVMMPGFRYGSAACLSTHSGCPLSCRFCQTGYMPRVEQLSAGQILSQLYEAEHLSGKETDRLVLMGMGEPLLNMKAVKRIIGILMDEEGRNWSPRRITVSTVGLAKQILKAARELPRVNLALSLHFTDDRQRQELMPGAESSIAELAGALMYYRRINGGKVSIEYALIKGLNDGDADARRLGKFAKMSGLNDESEAVLEAREAPEPPRMQPLPLHVNLIGYNPIASAGYAGASEDRIDAFAKHLSDGGVPVTVRRSRGADIAAACGQLGSGLKQD